MYSRQANKLSYTKNRNGFTLVELVLVIVLLGILSVGITGVIGLATKTYVDVSERDELLASARFAVERLNREVRNALPNSVRVANNSNIQCIEFVPIKASTIYVDIPVAPESATNSVSVIEFRNEDNSDYQCVGCQDVFFVNPLSPTEVYDSHDDLTGIAFNVGNFTPPSPNANPWILPIINGNVRFERDSSTERLYIADEQVSYCVYANRLVRFATNIGGAQSLPPRGRPYLMAENLANIDVANLPFNVLPATLQRNAAVQIRLDFERNDEHIVFNNEIHVANTP